MYQLGAHGVVTENNLAIYGSIGQLFEFFKIAHHNYTGFDAGGTRKAEARSMLAATLRQRLGEDAIEKLGAI